MGTFAMILGSEALGEINKSFAGKIVLFAVIIVASWVLERVNRKVFDKIQKKRAGLHLVFFERIASAVILVGGLILAFSVFGEAGTIWKTLLGGTAIISAVLVFAAQDIIRDILAGLMITLYRPFEIGNRVALEDGTTGIVKDITMRHVVLQLMDTQRLVIPNSKLNGMSLRNYSYHAEYRSAPFTFHIAYGTDVEKAMRVIRQAIIDSPCTIPGKDTPHGPEYAPIYFMAYEDSSLRLSTTVYYKAETPSETCISDVNLRVDKALKENGIEIPFNYVNVVQKQDK